MNGKNVLGIIFANIHEQALGSLTERRTMGSVPFLSRYRLIDFPLSNMVDSGVTKVGVITNLNFRSLMDHVGTGKPWDLNRKADGLYILPPFSSNNVSMWGNRIDAIYGNLSFFHHSTQDYVLLTDCNNVTSIDCQKLFDAHERTGADITIVGMRGKRPQNIRTTLTFDKIDEDGRIREMSIDRSTDEEVTYSTNIILMKKYLLESLIMNAHASNKVSFQRSVLMANLNGLKMYTYLPEDSFAETIDSVQSYYDISMRLLERENRKKLFAPSVIYTKERDDMPTIYGIESKVTNSLVPNGCKLYGTVENCILFKGVVIEPGAVVKNSIIMQDTIIGKNARLNCVIADKDVLIRDGVELSGAPSFPITLNKGTKV